MTDNDHDGKTRCFGNRPGQQLYADYHDNEWGIAQHDDRKLFEMLILEGAQAGLSWETVLNKREGYRRAFCDFDPLAVAAMSDARLDGLREDASIIRNRLKIYAARRNARVFLEIQAEFDSFNNYAWRFVDGEPVSNHWVSHEQVPVTTPQSDALSRDLKKRGMSFVGSTIMYAYMQAVGMVDDHLTSCWRYGR
jgi:DNA-3-methyladenine glycosylase I